MKLHVDSVQLEFDGRKILQDIFLQCIKGEVVGLLGRNGSGKSSLLRVIFGTLPCGFKHVSIDGEYITKGYYNSRIAYLPQHNYLPKDVVIEKLAQHIIDPEFWQLFVQQPLYIKNQQQKPGQLSGGELRQLETLMIIFNRADFILLDEPFTHVSPIQTEYLKEMIRMVSPRKGVIVTDHQYQNVLDISSRVILLYNGCTVPVQSAEDLVTYNYLRSV